MLLVLDATVGQNAISQVEVFGKIAGVTGLVMTKLDGTARGGILVAIAEKFGLPVHFIGVGEGVDDLQPFTARDFARAMAGTGGLSELTQATIEAIMEKKAQLNPFVKLALDFGPLILFFVVNGRAGIFWATGVFMAAVVIALLVSYVLIRRFPIMTIVTAFIVVVFGRLTIVLQNDMFMKMKPTIIYLLFAVVLAAGLVLKKPFLEIVFDSMFHLTEEGWHKLTIRWIVFFVAMAIVNEIVWRTQTTDIWVAFKIFGFIPITFVFALAQFPLMQKYAVNPDEAKS